VYTGSWIPCVGLGVFDSGGRNYKLSIIGKITGFSSRKNVTQQLAFKYYRISGIEHNSVK
jgi:hypothetical protein